MTFGEFISRMPGFDRFCAGFLFACGVFHAFHLNLHGAIVNFAFVVCILDHNRLQFRCDDLSCLLSDANDLLEQTIKEIKNAESTS